MGPARKATLSEKLAIQKVTEGDNVKDHIDSLFHTVDRLNNMDLKNNNDLLVVLLPYSLPNFFENFRVMIELRASYPTVETLKIKILESEARLAGNTERGDSVMYTRKFDKQRSDGTQQRNYLNVERGNAQKSFQGLRYCKCKKLGQ